jgi:anaerobic ribonucleoside-triphosphate reductase activating protein
MNYIKIRNFDISNGPGISVTLFCSGCIHNCTGCHNPETHCFNAGKPFTEETLQLILDLCKPNYISHLALTGGDPCHSKNWPTIKELVRQFKERYPEKNVWLWTGYKWEDVAEDLIGSGIDVVVDGQFKEELKDLRLKYRGSSNQRVIDVWKSGLTNPILLNIE